MPDLSFGPPGPAAWHRGLTPGTGEKHSLGLEGNAPPQRTWERGGEVVCLQWRKRGWYRAGTFGQNAPPSKRGRPHEMW